MQVAKPGAKTKHLQDALGAWGTEAVHPPGKGNSGMSPRIAAHGRLSGAVEACSSPGRSSNASPSELDPGTLCTGWTVPTWLQENSTARDATLCWWTYSWYRFTEDQNVQVLVLADSPQTPKKYRRSSASCRKRMMYCEMRLSAWPQNKVCQTLRVEMGWLQCDSCHFI